MTTKAQGAATENEFVISRTFNAPRELVWKMFTDPAHLSQWWGPKGFTVRLANMDFRPGGIFHYCLRGPDGSDMWGRFAYREITPPERIVYINSFSDESGGVARHPGHLAWPLEIFSVLTLAKAAGKTTLTLRWTPHNASAEEIKTFNDGMQSMTQGWTGTLDQLDAYLAKAQA